MVDSVPKIKLTHGQSAALDSITKWIGSNEPFFTLLGHAGTGKTTLMQEVARNYKAPMAFAAPTNKATKVLRSMARERGLPVECMTAYSANGLKLNDDAERKYISKAGKGKVEQLSLIVCDEASMVGSKLFDAFYDAVSLSAGLKVLFVGDPLQLPPVGDRDMQAFSAVRERAELTEIVRQAADNPIIKLGDHLRRVIRGEEPPRIEGGVDADGKGVRWLASDAFQHDMMAAFKQAIDRPGSVRAIGATNRVVDDMAERVRRMLYGNNVPPYIVGERVFVAAPIEHMHTDDEAVVEVVKERQAHPNHPDWDVIPLALRDDGGASAYVYAIHPEVRTAWEEHCRDRERTIRDIEKKRGRGTVGFMWQEHNQFKDAFADVRSVYALTAHRSQGSTFDEVFVHVPDIQSADRWPGASKTLKYRLLYVACTRARHNTYLRR